MVSRQQFELLYAQHSEAVFRYCYFRIRDRERAKELMQEAYMKTWEYNGTGKEIANPRAFVYRVAHNLILNEVRKKGRTTSLDALHEDLGFDPEDAQMMDAPTATEARRIFDNLEAVGAEDAALISMRFADDLSLKEISDITGETENAIAVRLHRAQGKLKKLYHVNGS